MRYSIAEAAALLGCSTNRIHTAEDDGPLPCQPKMAAAPAIRLGRC